MAFNAGQTLLRFVEDFPHGLNGCIEGAVGNDVAATEEVVILAARALEFALQNAQRIGIVVDALHDGRLILNA